MSGSASRVVFAIYTAGLENDVVPAIKCGHIDRRPVEHVARPDLVQPAVEHVAVLVADVAAGQVGALGVRGKNATELGVSPTAPVAVAEAAQEAPVAVAEPALEAPVAAAVTPSEPEKVPDWLMNLEEESETEAEAFPKELEMPPAPGDFRSAWEPEEEISQPPARVPD